MNYKTDEKDCFRAEQKIPKDLRVIKASELLILVEQKDKVIIKLCRNGYVWVDYLGEIRAAGLDYGYGGFHISGYFVNILGRSRGVYVKKEETK